MKRAAQTGICVLVLATGCAAPAPEPQPPAESAPAAPAAPAYEAQPGLSPQQRFREVLSLLEAGKAGPARVELLAYLDAQPDSQVAGELLRQLDTPIEDYFPETYREIELASGETLSTLARDYLGSVYQFHALARYNGIAQPGRIRAGQRVRIPLTPRAQEVFAALDDPAALTAGSAATTLQPTPTEAEVEASMMPAVELQPVRTSGAMPLEVRTLLPPGDPEALHRQALSAYRAQDLERAIALWDRVLAIDPDYQNARLYRTQAIELQNRLRRLN